MLKLTWKPNLGRTIIVDDATANAMPGQEKCMLWSRPEFGSMELIRVRGLIDRALDRSRRKGMTPAEALFGLQWTHESRKPGQQLVFDYEDARDLVITRGLEKMQKEDPNFGMEDPYVTLTRNGLPTVRVLLPVPPVRRIGLRERIPSCWGHIVEAAQILATGKVREH